MIKFPSMDEVRKVLHPLNTNQLKALEAVSGVPWHTIYKIKLGYTPNPGIETVRQVLPHINARTVRRAAR